MRIANPNSPAVESAGGAMVIASLDARGLQGRLVGIRGWCGTSGDHAPGAAQEVRKPGLCSTLNRGRGGLPVASGNDPRNPQSDANGHRVPQEIADQVEG